ncbi:hypothetical protein D3C81_1535110 [compost metagenome]
MLRLQLLGEVIFASRIGLRLVVGIAVFVAVAQRLHQLGRRIAQVQRHLQRAMGRGIAHRRLEAHVHRIALRRAGQINDRLRDRQLALGTAETLLHLPRGQAQVERPRVGVADILAGHAHYAAGEVQRVTAAVEHAREPVQGGIRIGATHRLVQRADLVVEGLAPLVEAPAAVAQQVLQQTDADFFAVLHQIGGILQEIEQPPAITVGCRQQQTASLLADGQTPLAQSALFAQGSRQQLAQRRLIEALQHIDPRP